MWSRIPLVRLVIPYVAGVLLAHVQGMAIAPGIGMSWIPAVLVLSGGVFYGLLFSYRSRWLYGSFIIIFSACSGYTLTCQKQLQREQELKAILPVERTYLARLEEPFEMRPRSCRGMISLLKVRDSLGWEGVNVSAMVYTEPDSSLLTLKAGNYMLIRALINPVRPPANPGEFDFQEYLSRKGINHSTYLKKGRWLSSDQAPSFDLMHLASAFRENLLERLIDHGVEEKYFGIAAALLLGEDSGLDADTRDVYARAGAMHILCVSGLHVGVIFLVLNFIFGFLKHSRFGKALLPILLMASIWSYALITGLAPPVVRASCMISFFILGNTLGRQKNGYNTLAASAMLMLLIDPYLLFSAGFQLSFSAVLGIIALQRPLYTLFYFKYALPDKIWSITAVSIAAQLGTLPVVLYYFHQFPLYSLLTNLVVIPLSSLIIYAGILLVCMPAYSMAAKAFAYLLNTLISLMDTGVNAVESIPYGLAENIMTDLPMAIMIALIICCTSVFLMGKHKSYLIMSIFLVCCFSSYRLLRNYQARNQKIFAVYSVNGHSAYDIIQGTSHTFIADSALMASVDKINYSIRPHWQEKGLHDPTVILLPEDDTDAMDYGICKMVKGQGLRMAVWSGEFPRCHPPHEKLMLDLLIIRGNCPFDMDAVFQWFDPAMVILDSSVPPWIVAPENDERYWVCRERGAFMMTEDRRTNNEERMLRNNSLVNN